MKVVLVNPQFGPVGQELPVTSAVFPYGLAHIAQSLLQAGHDVEVFDPYSRQLNPDQVAAWASSVQADWLGITAMSTQYAQVAHLVNVLRKCYAGPIMLGGMLATYSHHVVLNHVDVDVCVIGDGVHTARELLAASPDDWRAIPGIAYKRGGEVVCTGTGIPVDDIDALGSPPYSLFDMDAYCKGRLWVADPTVKERHLAGIEPPDRVMTVISAWGCPYRCRFCSRSTDRVRLKSIDTLISEIRYLMDHYGVRGIHFVDELALMDKARGMALARAMKPLGILWDAQARVNVIDSELCLALRDAGCIAIGLGIESGSERILRAMNKVGVTPDASLRAVKAAVRAGLVVRHQLIMGYPGETHESVWETVRLFRRMGLPGRRFALIVPLPGSTLYDQCVAEGRITNEEAYLRQISLGYGNDGYFMNFMGISDDEVLAMKRQAEADMEWHYAFRLLCSFQWRRLRRFMHDAHYARWPRIRFTWKDAVRWLLLHVGLLDWSRRLRGKARGERN